MSGWERIEQETWEIVVERLPRPLLREEASQDLRYFAGRDRCGAETRPSLRELAARWGWVSRSGKPAVKKVRLLLASGEWEDQYEGHSKGTARAQQGHSKGTPETDESREYGSEGHSKGTVRARQGHGKGTTRDTSHRSTTSPKNDPPPTPPEGGKKTKKTKRKSAMPVEDEVPHVNAVWGHYRGHHPRSDPLPSDTAAKRIVWVLRQRVKQNLAHDDKRLQDDPMYWAVLQAQLVIDWAHTAPTASYLQGFNGNGTVKKKGGWLTIASIFKKERLDDNMQSARRWQEDGRPYNPMLGGGTDRGGYVDDRSEEELAKEEAEGIEAMKQLRKLQEHDDASE